MKTSYKDLIVWQKSVQLVVHIYSMQKNFPKHEMYGLSDQLRRASVSIAANIAEGRPKSSTKEFVKYLDISLGSLAEVETLLQICLRLQYINQKNLEQALLKTNEVGKMLQGLKKSLKQKSNNQELTTAN